MKKSLLLIVVALFAACKETPVQKAPDETGIKQKEFGPSAYVARYDTSVQSGGHTYSYSWEQKVKPQHYIMTNVGTGEVPEINLYPDYDIEVSLSQNGKLIQHQLITKDSLLQDINREFLDNAIMDELQLVAITPVTNTMLLSFVVKKPKETFAYRYLLYVQPDSVWREIQEEE